ncbi:MAG: VCBS domain-containing protein, partial [Rubripirellula sp.]
DIRGNDTITDRGTEVRLVGVKRKGSPDARVEDDTADVTGLYGSLDWNKSAGTYTYQVDNSNDTVNRLAPGDTINDVFEFTLKNFDTNGGSLPVEVERLSDLTITISGANDAPTGHDDANAVDASSVLTVAANGYSDAVLADSPVAYWRLNETTGTVAANELSPTSPDGLYSGGLELGQPGLVPLASDASVQFESGGSFIVPGGASINQPVGGIAENSFEFLFNLTDVNTGSPQALYSQGGGSNAFLASVSNGNLQFETMASGQSAVVQTTVLPDTTYHVVGVFDHGELTLYLNGESVATETASYNTIPVQPGNIFVPIQSGRLDELAVYESALTAQQVANHYRATGLLGNDRDIDLGDTRSVTSVTVGDTTVPVGTEIQTAKGGLVTVNADGSYHYNPNGAFAHLAAGEPETDTFDYTVTDRDGLTDTATVVITIQGENQAPTGITLSFDSVLDNAAVGTLVGSFGSVDVDATDTHTYTLDDDAGGLFTLVGNELRVNGSIIDTASHQVTVESNDQNDGKITETFEINVVDFDAVANVQIDLSQPNFSTYDYITIRRGGGFVKIDGRVTEQGVPTELLSQQAGQTQSITIFGRDNEGETVVLDHASGGFLAVPGGVDFQAGIGGNDRFAIQGNALETEAEYLSSNGLLGNATVRIIEGSEQSSVRFTSVDMLELTDFEQLGFTGTLNVGDDTLIVSSPNPIDLPTLTQIAGGSIQADGVLAIGNAEFLNGHGSVTGRILAESGSSITADGDLVLGDANSTGGFNSAGEIHVHDHMVTLLDADRAVLGSLTQLGSGPNPGTLFAGNGFLVPEGNSVEGYGELGSPNDIAMLSLLRGTVSGRSMNEKVTLPGYIGGNGGLNNAEVTGSYSPGFSPAISVNGSVAYGAGLNLIMEVGGNTPGSQHDQLIHTGSVDLNGDLTVELLNGHTPAVGDEMVLMTAEGGFTGKFDATHFPAITSPTGDDLAWSLEYDTNELRARIVPAAQVESIVINEGDNQRSGLKRVRVTFTQIVNIDLSGGDAFRFLNRDTTEIAIDNPVVSEVDGKTVVDFTFVSGPSVNGGGSLNDGDYE